ncbi:MAG TPA: arsenic resistance N-acetyltransferase ArsN2 [Bacteroidota bacterium]|nr:arsenic resistance N-acetyltransferase ArsN2 [Bacteroidota bacterium]
MVSPSTYYHHPFKIYLVPALKIRTASPADLPAITNLLAANKLPFAGVAEHVASFLVADVDGDLVGTAGLEIYGEGGLLRSVAVDPRFRNKGIGDKLSSLILQLADERAVREVYLLTTTAEGYFAKKGFIKTTRDNVAVGVLASEEFRGACPETAVIMKKIL